jgi:hypothetical protein
MTKLFINIIFQQDNDLKHTNKKAQNWFKINEINGLHSYLTLILVNIFDIIPKRSLTSIKIPFTAYMSFERE